MPPARTEGRAPNPYPWLKPGVLVGSLVPLALLGWSLARGTLGADPVAIALNRLGLLALILLLACLTATPLRLVFSVSWPLRVRRMLGLLAFAFATLHVLTYVGVDQGFAWSAIGQDIVKRPFITIGMLAWLTLVPLAATSNAAARRRLGPKKWQRLHRLVYLAASAAALHFILRVKRDLTEPALYASVLALLFWLRISHQKRRAQASSAAPALRGAGR
jgi:sulfoxide reductase heme-binding subunit YedZ